MYGVRMEVINLWRKFIERNGQRWIISFSLGANENRKCTDSPITYVFV